MPQPAGYVVLTEAPDPMHAHLVAGALEAEAIPCHVDEDLLADEFAMSQKLMGLQRVRVLVPGDRLDEARIVLEGMSQPRPEADELEAGDEAEPAAPEPSRRRRPEPRDVVILVLGVAVIVLAILLATRGSGAEDAPVEDPLYAWTTDGNTETAFWKRNGKPAFSYLDEDGDGVYEITHWYDGEGRLVTTTQDKDGNGIPELTWWYVPGGDWTYMSYDEDENGVVERFVYREADGVFERLLDEDQDGHVEVREFVRTSDGTVLQREEDRGRGEGWQRIR